MILTPIESTPDSNLLYCDYCLDTDKHLEEAHPS